MYQRFRQLDQISGGLCHIGIRVIDNTELRIYLRRKRKASCSGIPPVGEKIIMFLFSGPFYIETEWSHLLYLENISICCTYSVIFTYLRIAKFVNVLVELLELVVSGRMSIAACSEF